MAAASCYRATETRLLSSRAWGASLAAELGSEVLKAARYTINARGGPCQMLKATMASGSLWV